MNKIPDYDKTEWIDEETPLDAFNLNKIENGIYDNRKAIQEVESDIVATVEDETLILFGKDQDPE